MSQMSNNAQELEYIERLKVHKIQFYEALEAQRIQAELTKGSDDETTDKIGRRLFSNNEYAKIIQEIEVAKATSTTKTTRQYNLLNMVTNLLYHFQIDHFSFLLLVVLPILFLWSFLWVFVF